MSYFMTPHTDLVDQSRSANRMFERFFAPTIPTPGQARALMQLDVKETPEAYVVRAEIPGLSADEIEVVLTGETMTITGEKKREEKQDGEHWHIAERSFGRLERTLTFPTAVAGDRVEAVSADGVLTVRVHKAVEALPRTVKIKKA